MSRSSKGFADFFPTAPSVLQQKRSKAAQVRRRTKSPPVNEAKFTHALSDPPNLPDAHRKTANLSNGVNQGNHHINDSLTVQDESERAPGDLLNGVGSASSTSTVSSTFSAGHHAASATHSRDVHKSTSLTPLTTADSSPPANVLGSPHRRSTRQEAVPDAKWSHSLTSGEAMEKFSTARPQNARLLNPTHARPVNGEPKGIKVIYDPDLDRKLTSKERKSQKAQYEAFGIEVRSHLEDGEQNSLA